MQRIRRGKYFSPCKLGETPIVQALRGTIGQVEPMQRCGISVPQAQREPSAAVSESQNLKRESKSLILSPELTQRADFVTRTYTALSRLKRVKNSFLTRILRSHRGLRRQRLG